jgi:hypothetical protein
MLGIGKKRLVLSTLIILAVLAVPVGLGIVAWRALDLNALRFPEEEFAELEAGYGDAVVAARDMAQAELRAQRDALAAARAAVPPDAPIPADWDYERCLAKAWHTVQGDTLYRLAQDYLDSVGGETPLTDDAIAELKSRLGMAREAGNITELEEGFDPNLHPPDVIVEHFREYVLTAAFLKFGG